MEFKSLHGWTCALIMIKPSKNGIRNDAFSGLSVKNHHSHVDWWYIIHHFHACPTWQLSQQMSKAEPRIGGPMDRTTPMASPLGWTMKHIFDSQNSCLYGLYGHTSKYWTPSPSPKTSAEASSAKSISQFQHNLSATHIFHTPTFIQLIKSIGQS